MKAGLLLLVVAMATLIGTGPSSSFAGDTAYLQRQFAHDLINALNWDWGLPSQPDDSDMLAVLKGERTVSLEAEDAYDRAMDTVTVRVSKVYGEFTGKGWVSGIATPTKVHFSVFVPIQGEYLLSVTAKGDGQEWEAGGKTFKADSGGSLRRTDVGRVFLKPGAHKVTVLLPAEGAVDNLTLSAPTLRPVQPLQGWRFSSPLKRIEVAELAVTLLGLQNNFQPDPAAPLYSVAIGDVGALPPGVLPETATYYGSFTASRWIRAGTATVPLEVPLKIEKDGMYTIKARHLGRNLTGTLDDLPLQGRGRDYFFDIDLGGHPLSKGDHRLILNLEPTNGIDTIRLEMMHSSPSDFMSVAGIPGNPSDIVAPGDATLLLKGLASRFRERK